jgi:digeranylgeranylglycerophospholipid reductase
LVAPSGIAVTLPSGFDGYIVSREIMEREMTEDAIRAGVRFLPDTSVLKAFQTEGGLYESLTTHGACRSRCLILADGIESRLARNFGWNTSLTLRDIHTCAFARVSGISVESDTCAFYLGQNCAPGGYVWVFPRGSDNANVGLGINGIYSEPGKARNLLFEFIDAKFPGSQLTDIHCGGVPMSTWQHPLVNKGVMLVGDAARMMNCSSGAGINYALFSGQTAGAIAAQAVGDTACSYDHLKTYEKAWAKHYGKQQVRSYALKEAMIRFDDAFFNRVAASIVSQRNKRLNVVKVFLEAFSHHPILMYKAFKLYKP